MFWSLLSDPVHCFNCYSICPQIHLCQFHTKHFALLQDCSACVIMNTGGFARQSVCYKKLFPFLITNGELALLQLQHHSLQSAGQLCSRSRKDCLQGLMVWVDCDVMFAVQVSNAIYPCRIRSQETLSRFEHSFVLWCVKKNRQDVSLAVKPHLLHSQMRLLEVSLGGVGHNRAAQLLRRWDF